MDARPHDHHQRGRTMTVAQMAEQHSELIATLRERVCSILQRKGPTMSLATIEAYLKKEQVESGSPLRNENTFDVRDAIAELVEDGVVKYTLGRQVQLTQK